MKTMTHHLQSKIQGFTLIEMIVSIGIFTIVMLMATSTIFTVVAANNKAQSLKLVMDNLDFALQSMTRELRVGHGYACVGDCSSGWSNDISFISYTGESISYRLDTSKNEIIESTPESSISITASDIVITSLKFYLFGGSASNTQPRVLIAITGTTGGGTAASTFNIQTTVSERQTGAGS